jgi:hypothetical protein
MLISNDGLVFLTAIATSKHCGVPWEFFYYILYKVKNLKLTLEQAVKT